ncbi:hypothetical protein ACOJQI_22835 (plasmid) [Bacillus salacetis]|uniref:hypothetical protein n=1 Tax=Bacillus salacetis TaxID=2315464 RepID=UPI003BA0436E
MKNSKGKGQQIASKKTVGPQKKKSKKKQELPMAVQIFASLAESSYKFALATFIITLTVMLVVSTLLWANGIIPTTMYIALVQWFLELLQNFILV